MHFIYNFIFLQVEIINRLLLWKRATDDEDLEDIDTIKTAKTGIGAGAIIGIIISILICLMYCISACIFCCMCGRFKQFRQTHLVEVDEQGEPIGGYNYANNNEQVQQVAEYDYTNGVPVDQTGQPYYANGVPMDQTGQPYYTNVAPPMDQNGQFYYNNAVPIEQTGQPYYTNNAGYIKDVPVTEVQEHTIQIDSTTQPSAPPTTNQS